MPRPAVRAMPRRPVPGGLGWNGQLRTAKGGLMQGNAVNAGGPAALAGRVRSALESGDLDAIKDLLDPGVRWGAPRDPVISTAGP